MFVKNETKEWDKGGGGKWILESHLASAKGFFLQGTSDIKTPQLFPGTMLPRFNQGALQSNSK